MYSLPSASHMREPSPRTMKGGSPPTARKARTGESTPPGIRASARFCSLRDSSKERMGRIERDNYSRDAPIGAWGEAITELQNSGNLRVRVARVRCEKLLFPARTCG